MSIDIFGRQLVSGGSKNSIRGPSGVGFKITTDNQYDMDNKRLCNIAKPQNPNDAVSLSVVQHILLQSLNSAETKIIQNINKQRGDVESSVTQSTLQQAIDALDSKIHTKISKDRISIATIDKSMLEIVQRVEKLEHQIKLIVASIKNAGIIHIPTSWLGI